LWKDIKRKISVEIFEAKYNFDEFLRDVSAMEPSGELSERLYRNIPSECSESILITPSADRGS